MKDGHQIDQRDFLFYTAASYSYPENFRDDRVGDAQLAEQKCLISAVGLFPGADLRPF